MEQTSSEPQTITGRFAPSPTGRMHLGNIYAALLSWLSVRSRNGRWILRIEDLDPQRSKLEYAIQIEDDLRWLGLDWDAGGVGPDMQSRRHHLYEAALQSLVDNGLTYPCICTRADIMSTQAPHLSDGRVVYAGTCRPCTAPPFPKPTTERKAAVRLWVPDSDICFTDGIFGPQQTNLAHECGDFVLRRADGAWAYQLAVVVDDALMGVTEVLRGCDLLQSAAQQIYLHRLLGYNPPEFVHIPLLCNEAGQRLSKRDASLSMEILRRQYSAEQIIGMIGHIAGITTDNSPISTKELVEIYDRSKIPAKTSITL